MLNFYHDYDRIDLLKISLAVKKCGPVQNGQCEKSCAIKGGGQEMAVMV